MALTQDTTRPPSDSRSECLALVRLTFDPHLVGAVKLGPLLNFWEHRAIWEGMARVHRRTPGLSTADFFKAVVCDLHAVECPKAASLMRDRPHKAFAHGCEGRRLMYVLFAVAWSGELFKPIGYWVARLERVQAARRLIQQAQDMASAAWQGDVEQAREIARTASWREVRSVGSAVVEV